MAFEVGSGGKEITDMGTSGAGWMGLFAFVLLVAGCPEATTPADDDTVADDDDTTAADDDDTIPADPCAPIATGTVVDTVTDPVEPYVTGRILDASGADPVAGIKVVYCLAELCKMTHTDEDGRYWIEELPDGVGDLFVVGNVNTDDLAYVSLVAWFTTPDTSLEAPEIHLPAVDLLQLEPGEQTIDAGSGLEVTMDPAVVEWAALESCFGAVEIPEQTMTYVQVAGVHIHGAWGFHFHGNTTTAPVQVSFPVRGELACDQEVVVYAMDKEHGVEEAPYLNLLEVATGHHDCDADRVVLDDGEGIEQFTWLAYGVVTPTEE